MTVISSIWPLYDPRRKHLIEILLKSNCDGTGFSTTFLPSVVPYSRPYMWLRVLLTSRSLLVYLATLCMQSFTPLQAHPPSFRCKLNYLSASSSSFGLHPSKYDNRRNDDSNRASYTMNTRGGRQHNDPLHNEDRFYDNRQGQDETPRANARNTDNPRLLETPRHSNLWHLRQHTPCDLEGWKRREV